MLSGSSVLLTIGLGFERRNLSTWPRRPGRPGAALSGFRQRDVNAVRHLPLTRLELRRPGLRHFLTVTAFDPPRGDIGRRVAALVLPISNRRHVEIVCAAQVRVNEGFHQPLTAPAGLGLLTT
jgi:hypothetical protein